MEDGHVERSEVGPFGGVEARGIELAAEQGHDLSVAVWVGTSGLTELDQDRGRVDSYRMKQARQNGGTRITTT